MFAEGVYRELWGTDGTGFWTDDSAPRLLELFRRRVWEGAGPDREELSKLFQGLIAIQFVKHRDWRDGLVRVHLRPDDVAQDVAIHLLRKAPRIWRAIGPRLRGERRNHYKLLLAACNTTIVRKVLELIKGVRRKGNGTAAYVTDMRDDNARIGSPSGAFAGRAARPENRFEDAAAAAGLLSYLRAAEDEVFGDIVVCGKRAVDVVSQLHGRLCKSLARGEGIIPHEELPVRLRDAVSPGLHALIVSRLIRQARRYAAAAA